MIIVGGEGPAARECYRQRVDARLSLRDAAKALGLTPRLLSDFEWGRAELPGDVAQAMEDIYQKPRRDEPGRGIDGYLFRGVIARVDVEMT